MHSTADDEESSAGSNLPRAGCVWPDGPVEQLFLARTQAIPFSCIGRRPANLSSHSLTKHSSCIEARALAHPTRFASLVVSRRGITSADGEAKVTHFVRGGAGAASCENDPSSCPKRMSQPRPRDRCRRDLVERNHFVDAKPGRAELMLELAPSIKVDVHTVDSPIIHAAIAE